MKSISKVVGGCQQTTLSIGREGVKVHRPCFIQNQGGVGSVKRGKITQFTKQAARRLREALFSLNIPESTPLGITLTVPWRVDDFEPLLDEFRRCFNRFSMGFVRTFPDSGLIWRAELQKRGAPHIHAVVYLVASDSLGKAHYEIRQSIRDLWLRSVVKLHGGSKQRFRDYGVKVDSLSRNSGGGQFALFRYLADHASKHKREQLGYTGKQWGIVGRSNFVREVDFEGGFDSPKHEAVFWRMMRKLTRYRIDHCLTFGRRKDEATTKSEASKFVGSSAWFNSNHAWELHKEPPFGCVYRGGRRRSGVIFVRGGGATVRQAIENARRIAIDS